MKETYEDIKEDVKDINKSRTRAKLCEEDIEIDSKGDSILFATAMLIIVVLVAILTFISVKEQFNDSFEVIGRTMNPVEILGTKTMLETLPDGTQTLIVPVRDCYSVSWTDEEICKRENVRVEFVD